MTDYVGLTWDHPRGRHALAAAAELVGGERSLRWEVQSLEGFESAPVAELARRYDLLVLDHPHLGDAVAAGSLRPIDELFDGDQVRIWEESAVGPSMGSYRWQGRLWALPLDAATQVSVRLRNRVPDPPQSWDEALELAERGTVAVSVAGPHAFLSWCSITRSLGGGTADDWFEREAGRRALAILTQLAGRAPAATAELNPIGLLDRMRDRGDIDYIPLVYGYVGYSSPAIAFGRPPGDRVGSTLGGTGIAVSRRCEPCPELLAHLRWLLEDRTQREFIPRHDGQPSARSAWLDAQLDQASHGFYSQTLSTIEQAYVRPRHAGYVPFQSVASRIVRSVLRGEREPDEALDEIDDRFQTTRAAALDTTHREHP